jgi:rhodanese-related sulfurtransferase
VTRKTIGDLLQQARSRLPQRPGPEAAHAAVRERGAVLIDIRSETQRARDGAVPQAVFVPRNVVEWRLDPSSGAADPGLARTDAEVVVMCDEGYQSSLVAATLQELGFARATDLDGGFQAWRAAGLPVVST